MLRSVARTMLLQSRAYRAIRCTYHALFNRDELRHLRTMRQFYAQFIRKDDLVFDVGANIGEFAEIFLSLGAKVVAVEPNPECCQRLRQIGRRAPLVVECVGISDHSGFSELHIGRDSGHSTLSQEWMSCADAATYGWNRTVKIPLLTLDDLVRKYGVPAFIKIDVEGYEAHVFRGISVKPKALIFEFLRKLPDQTAACLDTVVLSDGYEFNFILGEKFELQSPNWLTKSEISSALTRLAGGISYGNVIARARCEI